MANAYSSDISSPMGAAEEYSQQIAKTAFDTTRAKVEAETLKQEQDKTRAVHDELLQNEAFSAAVKNISPGLRGVEGLSALADTAVHAGKFSEAEKILEVMSKVSAQSALQEQRAALQRKEQADTQVKQLEQAREIYGSVKDARSKAAADALYESVFKEVSPVAKTPYSPELIGAMTGGLKQQVEKARLAELATRAARETAQGRKDNIEADADKTLKAAKEDAVRKKEAATAKAGGKLATASVQEKATTLAMIKDKYPDLENAKLASEEISNEAKMVLARSEAPDYTAAVRKVMADNPQRFMKQEPQGMSKLWSSAKSRYSSEAPKTPAEKGSMSELPKGAVFLKKTPQGKSVYTLPDGSKVVEE